MMDTKSINPNWVRNDRESFASFCQINNFWPNIGWGLTDEVAYSY